MKHTTQIEAILFVASKPLSYKKIAAGLGIETALVEESIEVLKTRYNHEESGIHILESDTGIQMASNPFAEEGIRQFMTFEVREELTKAQLETLTVIAYQGPITRPEIEQIRGVNCSVILRTLLIRDLIEQEAHTEKLVDVYTLSVNALAHLGIQSVTELPNYEELHKHPHLKEDDQSQTTT